MSLLLFFHRRTKYGNGIESSLKWLQNFKQNGKEITQVTIMNEWTII